MDRFNEIMQSILNPDATPYIVVPDKYWTGFELKVDDILVDVYGDMACIGFDNITPERAAEMRLLMAAVDNWLGRDKPLSWTLSPQSQTLHSIITNILRMNPPASSPE